MNDFLSRRAVDSPVVFFFNDTATTEIYTLSLHDALPISPALPGHYSHGPGGHPARHARFRKRDRKSTRLNSSHGYISYAVFCLKKKNVQVDRLDETVASRNETARLPLNAMHPCGLQLPHD